MDLLREFLWMYWVQVAFAVAVVAAIFLTFRATRVYRNEEARDRNAKAVRCAHNVRVWHPCKKCAREFANESATKRPDKVNVFFPIEKIVRFDAPLKLPDDKYVGMKIWPGWRSPSKPGPQVELIERVVTDSPLDAQGTFARTVREVWRPVNL